MAAKTLYTVIVADDEDELREAVCTMIPWEDYGFRLVGNASNGLDALQLVEKHEPDLLLTDIRMPFISGIELARQVREVRPATNIAFLSGYDSFEYAKQAIQYNIISYMLKPLTMEGLAAELRNIRQKIDDQFALFRQAVPEMERPDHRAAMLMPLVLDEYAEPEEEARLEEYGRQCGLLRDKDDRPCYTVMVSALLSQEGDEGTTPSFVASVDTLAAKYLRGVSFFAFGKVITVLMGNRSDFEEYLHILADEIPQMTQRVLGRGCRIGVSRLTNTLTGLHGAYREAMEAFRQSDGSEGSAQFVSDLEPAVKGGSLLCKRALDTLDQHYMDADLSLVSLSSMLDVSPNHLSACIKKYAGETFINILIRKRMEAARELLSDSALKIQDISQRCGYTDQHYFSYCFKKYCGESPNAMRRRLEQARAGDNR
ncbi:response regulator [Pseudoflavonifractor sp. AF19-9AC]|uniref:response regulator n=1 Tax=Pseudoflavonifractor sp. AF19-9AC TaxID=2292244 RepID=UPI000E4E3D0F|nr:response regulator [Pseudoflavonifractor sp. AF19-9AC]RHR10354.1 response regulator [Pseudoflavonifractor sp. AF19-9AC]